MAHFGIPKRAELISHGSLGLKAILKSHSGVSYPFEPYRTPEAGLTLVFCSVAPQTPFPNPEQCGQCGYHRVCLYSPW
ncbi:hypothetical protein ALP20_200059 [Pseudomonas coronafaciens pv. coronafaciens]|nr:hypothetical protein ALP20_200059 [Pseudomonas coronafaciens pv. coronafaciens]